MSSRIRCWACNAEWPASTAKCYKCGQPFQSGAVGAAYSGAATQPSATVADAVPHSGGQSLPSEISGVDCDGDKLVMIEGCEMPRRCPPCNSSEALEPVELNLRRDSKEMGGVSGLIKAGADALAGWNYTGPVSVAVYFCERHRVRLRKRFVVGAVIALVCIVYLVVVFSVSEWDPNAGPSIATIVAAVGAIGGVVMIAIYAQNPAVAWFKPRRFVDRTVWVTGACRQFLDTLPKGGRR